MKKEDKNSHVGGKALVEAVFKKFPNLDLEFEKDQFSKVSFRTLNSDVLAKELNISNQFLFLGVDREDMHTIKLFSRCGYCLGQVGWKTIHTKSWFFWKSTFRRWFRETIREAITRCHNEQKPFYLIAGFIEYEPDHLIISIPPNDLSFEAWQQEEAKLAEETINTELRNKIGLKI